MVYCAVSGGVFRQVYFMLCTGVVANCAEVLVTPFIQWRYRYSKSSKLFISVYDHNIEFFSAWILCLDDHLKPCQIGQFIVNYS